MIRLVTSRVATFHGVLFGDISEDRGLCSFEADCDRNGALGTGRR